MISDTGDDELGGAAKLEYDGDAEEDGVDAHVHVREDEYGNVYTIVAYLDDNAEDAEAQRDRAHELAARTARDAGYGGHTVVSWYGARQGPNTVAVYLFRTQRLADAFLEGTRGQSLTLTLPWASATADEAQAFLRGKQLSGRGSERDFAGMFML